MDGHSDDVEQRSPRADHESRQRSSDAAASAARYHCETGQGFAASGVRRKVRGNKILISADVMPGPYCRIAQTHFAGRPRPRAPLVGFETVACFPCAGAKAVERRNTKLVVSKCSLRAETPDFFSTSSIKALNASFASSVCDICTVVRGGVVNCAKRISSKPTTERSCGIVRPQS